MQRIGLLGGTFNPVHFGHLQLAKAAMAECNLDQIVFIPSGQPPHKDEAALASFADRIAMLQLACANDKGFSCTAIEEELPVPSYTIDTLRAIGKRFPASAMFFFIIGADAFLDLLSWKAYEDILRCVTLIVAERKGCHAGQIEEFLKKLHYVDRGNNVWQGKDTSYRDIILLHAILGNYSSTAIRAKISKGVFPEKETPGRVVAYIKKYALYQSIHAITERCVSMD